MTSATPGIARRLSPPKVSTSPTSPMIVRVTPLLTNASPPAPSTRAITAATSSGSASGFITTTMASSLSSVAAGRGTSEDGEPDGGALRRLVASVGRLVEDPVGAARQVEHAPLEARVGQCLDGIVDVLAHDVGDDDQGGPLGHDQVDRRALRRGTAPRLLADHDARRHL